MCVNRAKFSKINLHWFKKPMKQLASFKLIGNRNEILMMNIIFLLLFRDEYGKLYDFVKGKNLRVKNIGDKGVSCLLFSYLSEFL